MVLRFRFFGVHLLCLTRVLAMADNRDYNPLITSSALKVNKGIPQPSTVNKEAAENFRLRRKPDLSAEAYVKGILNRDRVLLSRAITLIESSKEEHYTLSQKIIEACIPNSGKSLRIGITGVPGVGKSTFIEALGKYLIGLGHRTAVLAVDPSSSISGGSILGDKTRMEQLAVDENAFIRPSPSAGSLGGVARKTKEIIILCEAAGYDIILVETVGVGQSETAVHSMVDFFLLLMLAGAGDELQGIKRGIIEMCDGMAINKADGDNIHKAEAAKVQYENALHLFMPSDSGWRPKVLTCSSLAGNGVPEVWEMIRNFERMMKNNGVFETRRSIQRKNRMHETIAENLKARFYNNPKIIKKITETEEMIAQLKITEYQAASILLNAFFDDANQKR